MHAGLASASVKFQGVLQVNQVPFIPRCIVRQQGWIRAKWGESQNNRAPVLIHSRQTALSIFAEQGENGSDFLGLLSWCWRHHKSDAHALVLNCPSPAVDFSQEPG